MEYLGRILLVDDDKQICKLWEVVFKSAGFVVHSSSDLDSAYEKLKQFSFDVVMLDLNLGEQVSGLDGLPRIISLAPFAKVFILTSNASVESAVGALTGGADGYIQKDEKHADVVEKIKQSLTSQTTNSKASDFQKAGLIGTGDAYEKLCGTITQLKDVDSTILITGESGTGKEVVARAIHRLSKRASKRFEAINCAAIPEALLESELFGHKKGAFTDAKTDRKGIFELCSEGTLLLDEIGDMPLILQAKLLRVLQERVVVPVGSSKPIKINTRVLAATHRNLEDEIAQGKFRSDLFFRLSVLPIAIEPLRNRKEEIPALAEFFLQDYNTKFDKKIASADQPTLERLRSYDWPGNIRELKNAIERGVVLSQDQTLNFQNMFQHLHSTAKTEEDSSSNSASVWYDLALTDAKQAFEKAYIENLLKLEKGNIAAISRKSGRYRVDIYRIIEKYGIDHKGYR